MLELATGHPQHECRIGGQGFGGGDAVEQCVR